MGAPSRDGLAGAEAPAPSGRGPADGIPSADYFAFNEWSESAFHTIEVQACGKTNTIQFACGDYSGDYHGENPSGVALSLEVAEQLARWVLDHISLIAKARGEA